MPLTLAKTTTLSRITNWSSNEKRLSAVTDEGQRASIKNEHNVLKSKRTGLLLDSEPVRLPLAELRKRGRFGTITVHDVEVLAEGASAETSGPSYTMPLNGFVKLNGWSKDEAAAGTWIATRVPNFPLVSGGMDACTTVQLLGNSPHGQEESTLPKIASGHLSPYNDLTAIEIEIDERIADMRDDGLDVSMSLAGAATVLPESMAIVEVVRNCAMKNGITIIADKAGDKRDGHDRSFVEGSVIEKVSQEATDKEIYRIKTFNTLRFAP